MESKQDCNVVEERLPMVRFLCFDFSGAVYPEKQLKIAGIGWLLARNVS